MKGSMKLLKLLPKGATPVPGTKLTTKAGATIERFKLEDRYFEVVTHQALYSSVYEVLGAKTP